MTLLAPLFLAGLLAVGLPVWLHRLSSENPNRKPFSSLMFLEAGEPQRVLAKNLQYLLLLLLRVAVLALLAFAFAEPALWRSPAAAAGDGAQLHLIVLDRSASMTHADRWARARSTALDLIDDLAPEDLGQVIGAGRSVELLTGAIADRATLRQAVTATSPGVFFVDYGQLMRALDGVVRNVDLPVVMHIVTDAQRSSLPTRFAELAPARPAELRIHNVAPDGGANWAVDGLAGSAVSGALQASVRSFAPRAADRTLRLQLNGETVATKTVTVPAGESVPVAFDALPLAAGSNRVSATLLAGDELELDDTRFIAVKRPEPSPVLLVSGDLRGRDTLFVAAAMESLTGLALAPERIAASELTEQDLADYRLIVVADAAAIASGALQRLQDYVESGGGLLMALGPRSTSLTAVPLTGQLFGPGSGGRLAAASDYASVGAMDASHPALGGLDALRSARFFRFASIQAAAADRVLVSLDNGAPLLLETELGLGRVLVFTSSLDREWSDLPVQPVFVPLIAGIADHLLGGAGFSQEAELGSTLALRAMGLQGGQIFDPRGDAALGLGGTGDVLLDQIGFYELVGGGSRDLVAVNFDVRESDLTPIPAATLERWQGLGRRAEAAAATEAAAAQAAPRRLSPLAQWLLILLAVAVIMESWVGNWHLRVRRGIAA